MNAVPKSVDSVEHHFGLGFFDYYIGFPHALIQAGIIDEHHLAPQPGRRPGRAVFLADGAPIPGAFQPGPAAIREPGFRAVQRLNDGRIRVEVTVDKRIYPARRPRVERHGDTLRFQGLRADVLALGIPSGWLRKEWSEEWGRWPWPDHDKRSGRRFITGQTKVFITWDRWDWLEITVDGPMPEPDDESPDEDETGPCDTTAANVIQFRRPNP